MRIFKFSFYSTVLVLTLALSSVQAATAEKEWTFLTYINGNNNLDSYGAGDINEMEKVGSTDYVNVVVQWASEATKQTKRLLVVKDNDPSNVTSPILENMGLVDMGSAKTLAEFIKWGVTNYPAKKYFINVWNHGNGWHFTSSGFKPTDLSYDELSGNHITTEELGQVLREAAAMIGHKISIYGSDACLMNMAEVAGEFSDAVEVMVGSEQTEPLDGWPYDDLLAGWKPGMTAAQVGTVLTNTYVDSYMKGSQGSDEVTFSALDLTKFGDFSAAVKTLGAKLQQIDQTNISKVKTAFSAVLNFTMGDYRDFGDMLTNIKKQGLLADDPALSDAQKALKSLVIANRDTSRYANASGISLWLPTSSYTYDNYIKRYSGLTFNKTSYWADALKRIYKQ